MQYRWMEILQYLLCTKAMWVPNHSAREGSNSVVEQYRFTLVNIVALRSPSSVPSHTIILVKFYDKSRITNLRSLLDKIYLYILVAIPLLDNTPNSLEQKTTLLIIDILHKEILVTNKLT